MKISDVMDRDLTAVTEDFTLEQLIGLLRNHQISSVPVVDDKMKLLGIISEKDVLRASLPGYVEYLQDSFELPDFGQFQSRLRRICVEKVGKYMARKVLTFKEDDTAFAVASALIRHKIRRAPIVSDNGVLMGMVHRADLLERIMIDEVLDED